MIINKRSVSGNLNLIRFLFPNYELITDIPEKPTRPAIFVGDIDKQDDFIKKYQEAHLDYLVKSFSSEINLDDRRILANILFERYRNATMPKYLEEIIDDIPQQEFLEMSKIKWVSGKWKILNIDNENNFLTMIEDLNKSKFTFMKSYFNCLDNNEPYILESSFITFLLKAKNKNYIGNSFQYRKKLEMYKGEKLENTLKAIDNSLEYNIDNPELRLLNLLINIQDSSKRV